MDKQIKEGATAFGTDSQGAGSGWLLPSGQLGKFFAKFFATKAQVDLQKSNDGAGDTIVNPEVLISNNKQGPAGMGHILTKLSLEVELNRKKRYDEFEKMDEFPEIGAAFDIYADDCTQLDIKGKRWKILSENSKIKEELNLFLENIKFDKLYWDIVRNTVKYGDCFTESVVNLEEQELGIQRLKILNPKFILRQENEFGYLEKFYQEIPDVGVSNYYNANSISNKFIELDKNQITHFRLYTSEPAFYPYGKGIAVLAVRAYRSLKLMEDAMLIYRLARAPERRIFYIDVGSLPATKAEMFIEKLKQKFKKEKFYSNGKVDERFNPIAVDEDFFVPVRGNQTSTKIETLPGALNLGDIDDVKYFRDKILAALKIPKDFIVEKDKSPERKANLAQLDVKFARTIGRVQLNIENGIQVLCKKQLELLGIDPNDPKNKFEIKLPDSSDMFTKRKLDIDEQKARVVQAVKGLQLISNETIYKEYYDYNDDEIAEEKSKMETQLEEDPLSPLNNPMGAVGPDGMPIMPPPGAAGGQEGAENKPPTAGPKPPPKGKPAAKSGGKPKPKPKSKKEALRHIGSLISENQAEKLIILNRIKKRLNSKKD